MYIDRDMFYLRNEREKAIKRKEKIVKNRFNEEFENFRNSQQKGYVRGKLNKGKVHCSCGMCKYEKHNAIEKPRIKAKKLTMQNEIDEYV